MTDYVLGIDGGGSKTLALLADGDGKLVGRGYGGSSNYHLVGPDRASASLDAAVDAAFNDARLARAPVRVLALGLSGVDRPRDRAVFEDWAESRQVAARTLILNDAQIVLAAGTPEGWGVAVICGTGSIAYAEDQAGRVARAGGWGHILGDEGSGYDIGVAALRAVARAADGRAAATTLTQAVLQHWSLQSPTDLFQRVYQEELGGADIARLAVLVERAAQDGDAVAGSILDAAGRELALAAVTVARRLALPGPVPCAAAGGVILHSSRTAAALVAGAADLGLQLEPLTPVVEPAQGALRIALGRR
jgi:N-acetylglucosamine kinase-like BadF-type ATPase